MLLERGVGRSVMVFSCRLLKRGEGRMWDCVLGHGAGERRGQRLTVFGKWNLETGEDRL